MRRSRAQKWRGSNHAWVLWWRAGRASPGTTQGPGGCRAWVEEREVETRLLEDSRDQITWALEAKLRGSREDEEWWRRDLSEGRFNRPRPRREKARVLVYSGHQNKMAVHRWLKNRNLSSSQFWCWEVHCQGASQFGFWWEHLPGLQMPFLTEKGGEIERERERENEKASSVVSSYSPVINSHPGDLINFNYFFGCPISKYIQSHFWVRFQHVNFKRTQVTASKGISMMIHIQWIL